ncbi:hypothetical protein NTGBS_720022 [Candidatus Nitrotoga sp. BS]|nr:hypothetical protein NTGBS_720022 [Candidatus Nitrotoga sp. BS]
MLNGETDIVQCLEWGTLFNRLVSESPPLVKRGGFQVLDLAELVFFGDVVDFDDGHSYLKSSLLMLCCLRIDASLLSGIPSQNQEQSIPSHSGIRRIFTGFSKRVFCNINYPLDNSSRFLMRLIFPYIESITDCCR